MSSYYTLGQQNPVTQAPTTTLGKIGQGLLQLGGGLLDNLGTTAAVAGGLAGVNQAYSRLGNIGEAEMVAMVVMV